MATEFKRVRDYELMVVFHPELSEEDLAGESSKLEGHISGIDGSIRLVNRETPWGRRRLAYPIRHGSRDVRDGNYVLYYFTAESGRIEDVEREIKLQDRIIRYLLTQQTTPMMEPTPAEEAESEEAGAQPAPQEATAADATMSAPSSEPTTGESPAEPPDSTPVDATEATANQAPQPVEEPAQAAPVEPSDSTQPDTVQEIEPVDAATDSTPNESTDSTQAEAGRALEPADDATEPATVESTDAQAEKQAK